MSTQTLEELYQEGLEIIRDNKLHQIEAPENIVYDMMDDYQQDIFEYYYQVDDYLEKHKIVENWTNKVLLVFKSLPNGTKLEIDFTAGAPDSMTEQEKMLKRSAYLEKLLSTHAEPKELNNTELLKYVLKLNDRELRIIIENNESLVLYVFREGKVYDLFKKAYDKNGYTNQKKNMNEYMRSIKKVGYLKQFVTIDMHMINIDKSGYIKAKDLEKLKAHNQIKKNTLTYTDISY